MISFRGFNNGELRSLHPFTCFTPFPANFHGLPLGSVRLRQYCRSSNFSLKEPFPNVSFGFFITWYCTSSSHRAAVRNNVPRRTLLHENTKYWRCWQMEESHCFEGRKGRIGAGISEWVLPFTYNKLQLYLDTLRHSQPSQLPGFQIHTLPPEVLLLKCSHLQDFLWSIWLK